MTDALTTPQQVTPVEDRWRTASLWAGPAGAVGVILFAVAIAMTGGDDLKMATSPAGLGSTLAGLVALVLMGFGLMSLAIRYPALRRGFGLVAWFAAATGTALVAGGQWTQLFALPGLARVAPELVTGIDTVQAGYIASFLVLAAGGILLGIALRRAGAGRFGSILTIIGGVLMLAPLPARFVLLAIAISVLARRR
ncbi:hypothetical protein Pth03_63460 [Planotetraspora thailandica]|uniref:Uncharacterized protein n=1 Tax=Planotetraspora thailandica TaxID=487172 RepID=A0A8J3V9D8_9ACTN|nr:hypothetical protein [Planotetraspora thailandica]GII57957.1 hypothetical protein Pth03_63460 [Planotetraspora thailandica]